MAGPEDVVKAVIGHINTTKFEQGLPEIVCQD